MVVQKAIKSYPMIPWLIAVAAVVLVAGVFLSGILSDAKDDNTPLLFGAVAVAILLPFLAMAFPRREVVTLELPTDTLGGRTKQELEGILAGLDEAKAKGEMDDKRHANARAKVLAALKAKK